MFICHRQYTDSDTPLLWKMSSLFSRLWYVSSSCESLLGSFKHRQLAVLSSSHLSDSLQTSFPAALIVTSNHFVAVHLVAKHFKEHCWYGLDQMVIFLVFDILKTSVNWSSEFKCLFFEKHHFFNYYSFIWKTLASHSSLR